MHANSDITPAAVVELQQPLETPAGPINRLTFRTPTAIDVADCGELFAIKEEGDGEEPVNPSSTIGCADDPHQPTPPTPPYTIERDHRALLRWIERLTAVSSIDLLGMQGPDFASCRCVVDELVHAHARLPRPH